MDTELNLSPCACIRMSRERCLRRRGSVVLLVLLLAGTAQLWAQGDAVNRAGNRSGSVAEVRPSAEPAEPTATELERGISLATAYMLRSSSPDGHFVYRVDPVSGQESESYNVVRHAGAMYALSMAYRAHPTSPVAHALERSAAYLREHYVAPVPETDELAVWSQPKPREEIAQLGASGLGLVALAAAREAGAASVTVSELQALGRFVLSLQQPDGRFTHRYSRASGPLGQWESLYYPGEAALGLVRLYEVDGSRQWLVAAVKALSFLAASRATSDRVPPDHWSLIATAELLPLCEQDDVPVPREQLLHHAVQIAGELLEEQRPQLGDPQLAGSFDSRGRTAPTATSVEGLLAALTFLPASKAELRVRVAIAAERGVAFLLKSQINSGTYAGALPEAALGSSPTERSLRIDFVQHTLCAYLRYRALISRAPTPDRLD